MDAREEIFFKCDEWEISVKKIRGRIGENNKILKLDLALKFNQYLIIKFCVY